MARAARRRPALPAGGDRLEPGRTANQPAATIRETVTTGSTPGSPNTGQLPTPGTATTLGADARKEYLAGLGLGASWYLNLARSLPSRAADDKEELDDATYVAMLTDPEIAASVNVFKAAVLENGPQFSPVIDDADDADIDRAHFLTDWCEAILADLTTGLADVLWNMADAFWAGHTIAELVYDYSPSYWALPAKPRKTKAGKLLPVRKAGMRGDGPQLILRAIKVKPRESVGFLVDAYMNILGILGHIPGQYYPIMPGMVYADVSKIPNLLPLEKFAVLTFRPKDADPRGTSIIRPAYFSWYLKGQIWAEYAKFLSQMAGGLIVGKPDPAAPSAEAVQGADGSAAGTLATREEVLLQTLLDARNGAVLVVQPGADVEVHYPAGEGAAFLQAFELLNLEIVKGILHVTLATEEGRHQARAASEVHADILGILVRQAKAGVEHLIRSMLQRMIRYNYGEDAVRLTPRVSLGDVDTADRSRLWMAVSQLMRAGYFSADQLAQVDDLLGLPVRIAGSAAQGDAGVGPGPGPDVATRPDASATSEAPARTPLGGQGPNTTVAPEQNAPRRLSA